MTFGRPAQTLMITLGVYASSTMAADLNAIRGSADAAFVRQEDLRAQELRIRADLEAVANRIERLKAKSARPLVANQDLERELKRSQKLSAQLNELANRRSGAETEANRQNQALVSALSETLSDLQRRWTEAGEPSQRGALVEQMRGLRTEREQLRARLSPADPPPVAEHPSESPEDLMEQADALRDSGDKIQQRIRELRARIGDLRAERDLDLRMLDFARDEALFDEQDRRVRSRGESRASLGQTSSTGGGSPRGPPGVTGQQPTGSPPTSGAGATATPQDSSTGVSRAADGRPEVGIFPLHREAGDNLPALEQKLSQLESLAKQLEQRARESELRAKALQR